MTGHHPFDPSVLANDPGRREVVLSVLGAALRRVDPARAVHRSLRRVGSRLRLAETGIDLEAIERIHLLAFGKASPSMARAALDLLEGCSVRGLVVSDHSEPLPSQLELFVAGHPLPDERSATAARAALELVGSAGERDLVLCLISGGGSALLELPAEGVGLAGVRGTVAALLESGAPIEAVNVVRKHLSAIKGGRLAIAASPARLLTLILSDVVGSPLTAIASGPTVPDPSTFEDALSILDRFALRGRVPAEVVAHLAAGRAGQLEETLKAPYPGQILAVVGDGPMAAQGAAEAADLAGIPVVTASTTLTGEARREAVRCIERAGAGMTVYAGETTVTVSGSGRGGRNQEGALAAALALEGDPTTVFAALGTDGVDGTTDAAGAIVDGETAARARRRGLDPEAHLADNDSHPLLRATGDLLVTGPTGTNVGDIWMVWRP